jgi:hypothetical protein
MGRLALSCEPPASRIRISVTAAAWARRDESSTRRERPTPARHSLWSKCPYSRVVAQCLPCSGSLRHSYGPVAGRHRYVHDHRRTS